MSKKESKKIKKAALEKFFARLKADFPVRKTIYPIVSSYSGSQDQRQLIYHEVIGTITEEGVKSKHIDADSLTLTIKEIKENYSTMVEEGYKKFNEITTERAAAASKKKSKKNAGEKLSSQYKARDIDQQTIRMHKFFWGGYTGNILTLIDINKPSRWEYTLIDDKPVFVYTETHNYLGIVKTEMIFHFYVDPADYGLQRLAQSFEGELHVPFGYKLSDDELQMVNALQMGQDTLVRYRARHAYGSVKRNVFYRSYGSQRTIKEKNLEVHTTIIDNKKKKLRYNAKAKVVVTGTPTIKR